MNKLIIIILLLLIPVIGMADESDYPDYEILQYDDQPDLDKLENDLKYLGMDKDIAKNLKRFFKKEKGIKCEDYEIEAGVCDDKDERWYLTIEEWKAWTMIADIAARDTYTKDPGKIKIKHFNWFINKKVK